MSGLTINLGFDQGSLASIQKLADFEPWLAAHLAYAMPQGLDIIQEEATAYMWGAFINPTGPAEEAWEQDVQSPYMGILTNTAPQGQRLHYGFSDMTDVAGRYFPYWPAYFWADHAVENAQARVEELFRMEVQAAIDEVQ